jgi:ankyrin repeat protein
VNLLATSLGEDVNYQKKDGGTALMVAVRHAHVRTVDVLVNLRANVNLQKKDGMTALMIGSRYDPWGTMVELLLKHEADVNLQKKVSKTRSAAVHKQFVLSAADGRKFLFFSFVLFRTA